MTTNLSECVNAVLKGVRNLPITAIVKATYFRLGALFHKKGQSAQAQLSAGHLFSQALLNEIQKNCQEMHCNMIVSGFSRHDHSFTVQVQGPIGTWSERTFAVRLLERTCDCGYFQALHYPCSHALVACSYPEVRLDWKAYVDDVYRIESVLNVYASEFPPIPNEASWPSYSGPLLRPDPELRRAKEGRPVSSRIRNEMDDVEIGQRNRCGLCRRVGHQRSKCPNVNASSSGNN